jgi:hypothetical protein
MSEDFVILEMNNYLYVCYIGDTDNLPHRLTQSRLKRDFEKIERPGKGPDFRYYCPKGSSQS